MQGLRYRLIDDIWYLCRDVGCDDFAQAEQNRKGLNSEQLKWWLWYEAVLGSWPLRKPLPSWIPQGHLPMVGKGEDLHQHGIYEIGDDGLIK